MSLENELEDAANTEPLERTRELLLRAVSTLRTRSAYIDDLEATAASAKRELRFAVEKEMLRDESEDIGTAFLRAEIRRIAHERDCVRDQLENALERNRELAERKSIWERLRLW